MLLRSRTPLGLGAKKDGCSPPKSSPTFYVRPRNSVGRVTVDPIRRSWVRFPPRSKDFFFTSCGSPLLGLTPSGLFMGSISTLIYTSELILCFTICFRRLSFPEAAILLVSDGDRDLWPDGILSPQITDFRLHCAESRANPKLPCCGLFQLPVVVPLFFNFSTANRNWP